MIEAIMPEPITITECPRDAMQGIKRFIPTETKASYINILLRVGFDVIDFGSFVSPKAVPQMKDTAEVLKKLDLSAGKSKLLAIVANYRGAEDACQHPEISFLGFPFSISETFQLRNTNSGISASFDTLKRIQELCIRNDKRLRIYLSMGFGNPYGDEWNTGIVRGWAEKLITTGIEDIYIADTTGVATANRISEVLRGLADLDISFGLHLHTTPDGWREKADAAYKNGCRSFDSAIGGYGGCPMAADELTGNLATENLISYLQAQNERLNIDADKLHDAMAFFSTIFSPSYNA